MNKEIKQKVSTQTDKNNLQFSAEYTFPADYPYFNGHFENNPVLPGIIQIRLISENVRNICRDFELSEISKVKFLKPIKALETITINAEIIPISDSEAKCSASIDTREGKASTAKLIFRKTESKK